MFQQTSSSDKAPQLIGTAEFSSMGSALRQGAFAPVALLPVARDPQGPTNAILAVGGLDRQPDGAVHPLIGCGQDLCRRMARGDCWNKKTQIQAMQTYTLFAKTLIERKVLTIQGIQHADVAWFITLLLALPSNYNKSPEQRSMQPRQLTNGILDPEGEFASSEEHAGRLIATTINRHIAFLILFVNYLFYPKIRNTFHRSTYLA